MSLGGVISLIAEQFSTRLRTNNLQQHMQEHMKDLVVSHGRSTVDFLFLSYKNGAGESSVNENKSVLKSGVWHPMGLG
jgi:hypothetical protein